MKYKKSVLATLILSASSAGIAQEGPVLEEVIVTGIRGSLQSALIEKRNSDSLIEVIHAVDIGKLPDQNLAEVLENISGIQITRVAGIGNGVQIRGTNANRTEINGVATIGSGVIPVGSTNSDRSGINFEDINASIISSVEVTKSPEAKTVEGSVGGTINLKTIRPLELKETLGSIRIQGEDSSLSSEGTQPRVSAAFGDNWDTGIGQIGFVISGSYTEQEAVAFRPRVDRDNVVPNINAEGVANPGTVAQEFNFVGVQFLTQETENDDYETTNLATTFEWAPNDNLNFYVDAFINDQEQSRDQFRLQASGVSTGGAGNLLINSLPTQFELVDLGTLGGRDLGSVQVGQSGSIGNLGFDNNDPNFRVSAETSSRITDTEAFTFGTNFENGPLSGKFEVTLAESKSRTPTFDVTFNFINPNAPLANLVLADDGVTLIPSNASPNENATPFIYDATDGLSFGIDFASDFAPTVDDLLTAENYALEQVVTRNNRRQSADDQVRLDLNYALDDSFVTSVDLGFRFNKATSTFRNIQDNIGGFSNLGQAPLGDSFGDFLVVGDSNFGEADGRELAIRNYLAFDTDRAFFDREASIAVIEAALQANNPEAFALATQEAADLAAGVIDPDDFNNLLANFELQEAEVIAGFYDIEEKTTALYAQANFESGIFRGNFGVRYVNTTIDSTGFDAVENDFVTTTGAYDFVLPRFNLVVNPAEDVVLRLGLGKDIRRPDFRTLNTGFTFNQNENTAIRLGNPNTQPELVDSFDISAEWYFAPAAIASIGYFKKDRDDVFGTLLDSAFVDQDTGFRDNDALCARGGLFNPIVVPNTFGDPNVTGLCVDTTTPFNDDTETTQTGVELAVQYDLSSFEDRLGWASGFGIIANATIQDFSGGSVVDSASARGATFLNAQLNDEYTQANFENFTAERGLLDFSETAYNVTLFYEKYGLSARARYTWREAFRTTDFAGGSSLNSTLGFPVVTEDRGQLNVSINYDITDKFNIGIEAVNVTEEEIVQSCLSEGGITCFIGLPDRRVTAGVSYRF